MNASPDEQLKILTRNAVEVVPASELAEKLRKGRPLRVKLGMDPTASDVHVGSAVPLRKLRQFQDLGHTAVLIVGDFTAQIGDPSEQNKTRPMLTAEEVAAFAASNLEQYKLILADDERLEVRYNSEWLASLGVRGVLELASHGTVAQLLQRDDFAQRFSANGPISVREVLYPLLQGYDSVAVRADVEIGGTDQHFNLLMGRHVQRAYGQEPQVIMTNPLVEGTDGQKKMSQSLGNYIGITEPPDEIFGKVMRVSDALIGKYLRLATDLPDEEVAKLEKEPPQIAKRVLAAEIVRTYHGAEAAEAARERFDKIFVEHEVPEDIPTYEIRTTEVYVPQLLCDLGLAASNSDGRRLIAQGGVHIDGNALDVESTSAAKLRGKVLRVGKRRHVRLT